MKYKAIIEDKLCVNYGIEGIFLLETKILWEWSEKLHIIIDYVNNQYEKYLNILKIKFTDGKQLRQLIQFITPPVLVSDKKYVLARRAYTQSLYKKVNKLQSLRDYNEDVSFQK